MAPLNAISNIRNVINYAFKLLDYPKVNFLLLYFSTHILEQVQNADGVNVMYLFTLRMTLTSPTFGGG